MSSTAPTSDAEIATYILKIIVFFLIAVFIAGVLLILAGDFLIGV